MAAARLPVLLCCLGAATLATTCAPEPGTTVLSRQAVEASSPEFAVTEPEVVETRAVREAAHLVEPPILEAPAALGLTDGTASDSAIADAAGPTTSTPSAPTTTVEPTSSTVASTSTSTTTTTIAESPSTTVAPSSSAPETTTTATPTGAGDPTSASGCAAVRHDNGLWARTIELSGDLDGDGDDDSMVLGLDESETPHLLVDFADGAQTDVGMLPTLMGDDADYTLELTGDAAQPIRVRRGLLSLVVAIEDCVPRAV